MATNRGGIKVKPKINSKRLPTGPNRKPLPQKKDDKIVRRLQELIHEKDGKIEALTQKINEITLQNKTLEKKIETLKKASGPPKKKAATGGGVSGGMSQAGAANALAAKLGGHVKNKKMAEKKSGGGVSSGMSQAGAKNALAGLLGGKKAAPKKDTGGVSSGMSQAGAAAALGGFLNKKKAPPKAASGGGGGNAAQYTTLFKKYETMMKLGINVHGAVGRMRQDGCDKAAIAAFEKKHGAYGDEEDKVDPASLGLKPKKEVNVGRGIKMKRLHWDCTNLKYVKGSIWEDLDESTIRYDKKHFELHFQVRQRKPVDEQKSSAQQAKSGEIITFVSKKRTQAVLIGLKNLNLDNDKLRTVLHEMNEKVMNVDTLSKLLEMAPTEDEQTEAEKKIMQEGTHNPKDYGTVEQFFFTLCDFFNLEQRLKLWMFKQNFYEISDALLAQYKTIGKACDKIRNNKNLKLLLTIVLAFGNHMNAGTRKGQTYGFDLKILTGMTAVKSFDNTRSLLMYIYEFCDRKYPNAIKVLPELSDTLKAASSMEMETLKQASQRITENMTAIKNLITSDEIENYDLDDKFIMELTKFHKKASPKIKKFNMTVSNVTVSTKRAMKKFSYGSVESPLSIESFFQIWWKFVQDFAASKEKLIELENERQKRIAKRKKAKNKQMAKKMHQKYGAKPALDDGGQGLDKGGSLYREFEKKKKFEAQKGALHGKLKGHVKQRSIFIANGGKVDDKSANPTMRRLSSMYQDQQSEVANALKKAREKAMSQYNRFKLPPIDKNQRSKWTDYSNIDNFGGKNGQKKQFQAPNDKQFSAPQRNQSRNAPNKKQPNMPSQNKKPQIKPKPKGYKPQTASPKANGYQVKPKGNFPPPPSFPQQKALSSGNAYGPPPQQNAYNPQNAWQQQPQPGYGSSTNLTYRQMQQMQQMQQYNPNRMGAYQAQQQQQQQWQRKPYGQQQRSNYKYPQQR